MSQSSGTHLQARGKKVKEEDEDGEEAEQPKPKNVSLDTARI